MAPSVEYNRPPWQVSPNLAPKDPSKKIPNGVSIPLYSYERYPLMNIFCWQVCIFRFLQNERYLELTATLLDAKAQAANTKQEKDKAGQREAQNRIRECQQGRISRPTSSWKQNFVKGFLFLFLTRSGEPAAAHGAWIVSFLSFIQKWRC